MEAFPAEAHKAEEDDTLPCSSAVMDSLMDAISADVRDGWYNGISGCVLLHYVGLLWLQAPSKLPSIAIKALATICPILQ